MKSIKIKNVTLGPGKPRIAVPVTGTSHEEIIRQVREIIKGPCDILEWRADYYFGAAENIDEKVARTEAHMEMIRILDDIEYVAGEKPLIFTIRGHGEGGRVRMNREHIFDLASMAAQSRLVDMVDVQMFNDDDTLDSDDLAAHIRELHEFGAKVILSYHDFSRMLSREEIVNVAASMRSLGADIVKLACVAETLEEAKLMQEAAAELTKGDQNPVIMVAMGEKGKATRITGGAYGSCISFARGEEATAPGQIDAYTLSKYLDKYYESSI